MKMAALSLGALCLAFNTQVIAKEAAPAKTAQATQQVAKASDNIDKYLAINIGNREMVVDENGQALSAFKHEITNIGQKPIKNIQWVGVYVNNRKVIYSQDMQINLETPLQPGKSININLQIPFVQLSEDARKVFMNQQEKIDVYPIERVILLDDKTVLSDR
ncbi:MAG: hypothetical protein E6Z62_04810 [Haemophilus parainfluenzae]|nr:hypothetical protein [Haemophilus parainfluenzae]